MRMGLIQQLETTHLAPVAAPSCDVMMLLRPAASGSSSAPSKEGGPAGLVKAPASEERVWETISCVVSSRLKQYQGFCSTKMSRHQTYDDGAQNKGELNKLKGLTSIKCCSTGNNLHTITLLETINMRCTSGCVIAALRMNSFVIFVVADYR
jgi:hypothetical protein